MSSNPIPEAATVLLPEPAPRARRLPLPSAQQLIIGAAVLTVIVFVFYPVFFVVQVSLNVGAPDARPITDYGLDNFANVAVYGEWLWNTLVVSTIGTVLAVAFGFILAWIVNRTNVPGVRIIDQLIIAPFYLTPLVGALAWSILGAPRSGMINQLWWRMTGTSGAPLVDLNSAGGIAWVMALYEGTVAYLMISAAMKSMDPSLEESSQVAGAGKFQTMLRITLPLLRPAIIGATAFVFAEMMSSFSAALILGQPSRFYVVTTGMYQLLTGYPADYSNAAAIGIVLSSFTGAATWIYVWSIRGRDYVTVTGKAFRPRVIDLGRWRWALLGFATLYVLLSTVLPIAALVYSSLLAFHTTDFADIVWTLDNYREILGTGYLFIPVKNSLILGLGTATIGVLLMTVLCWFIYRTRAPGRRALEFTIMVPQALPRMVLAFGMLWAWIAIPIGIYGTLWLLLIAYLTVLLPLGVRTISAVIQQLDRSLEECARVLGASWVRTMGTVTLPLLRPGLAAAWMLLFIVSIREIGVSLLLMSAQAKVLGPAIIEKFEGGGTHVTATLAIVQSAIVLVVMLVVQRIAKSKY